MGDTNPYLLCIAIDFGTTYSGYAFSFKSSKDNVKMNKAWGSNVSVTRYKAPTCVLTDKHGQFVAFGYDAHKTYIEDEDDKYHLFDKFKMALFKEKAITADMEIKAADDYRQPAAKIIGMAIKYFKKHVLQVIWDSNISTFTEDTIRWVLTVPAIWSDQAKMLMRISAKEAGIIDSENSENLEIALEPEAASLWCRQLPVTQFVDSSHNAVSLEPGTVYMVVDCGGGTVDITVHEVNDDETVKEVVAASGGDWGGTRVDQQFENTLDKLFKGAVMNEFKKDEPDAWFKLMQQFDTAKRSRGTSEILIQLPYSLMNLIMEDKPRKTKLQNVVLEANVKGVSARGQENIVFNVDATAQLFNPVIDNIEEHVRTLLKKKDVSSTKYIYLVGGFGDCDLLQQRLKTQFGSQRKVLIPQDAGMVVLKGAVLFGHRPSSINSRIARKTYGQAVCQPFDSSIHPPDKKINLDGYDYCSSCFNIWVRKGDEVKHDECRDCNLIVAEQSDTTATMVFVSSGRTDVEYTTEADVQEIGRLTVNTPDTNKPCNERKIQTKVFFGKTEIKVRVQSKSGDLVRDTKETTLKFA